LLAFAGALYDPPPPPPADVTVSKTELDPLDACGLVPLELLGDPAPPDPTVIV
jgi:hypothetical protein